jgi:hypothetical protein
MINLTPFPRETYQQFYDRLAKEVNNYILNRYGLDWRSAARQWGETDDQGVYAQFYYMVTKLRHFRAREKVVERLREQNS